MTRKGKTIILMLGFIFLLFFPSKVLAQPLPVPDINLQIGQSENPEVVGTLQFLCLTVWPFAGFFW